MSSLRELQPFDLDVVYVDVVADGLRDAGTQAAFVRASGVRADAVHVAADLLFRSLGPLQDDLDLDASFVAGDVQRRVVYWPLLALADDFREVRFDAVRG